MNRKNDAIELGKTGLGGAGVIVQRILSTFVVLSSMTACLPPPKDAGEAESTGTPSADGVVGSDADIEETLAVEPGLWIARMVPSPEGVVVALQNDGGTPPFVEVRAYSSSLELLWSRTLPDAAVTDLDDLGGGEYLVSGLTSIGETADGQRSAAPAVWRVSCCADVQSQTYPQMEPWAKIAVAEPYDGGLLLVGQEDSGASWLAQAPLELIPAQGLGPLPGMVFDGARTPEGEMIVRIDGAAAGGLVLVEIGDGVGPSIAVDEPIDLVGTGDELTLMRYGSEEVELQAYGEEEWVKAPVPGFHPGQDDHVFDRQERVVIVHQEGASEGPATLHLTELEDDGTLVRTLEIPRLQHDRAGATAVAVGEDGAIYLSVSELDAAGTFAHYLHRIAPL